MIIIIIIIGIGLYIYSQMDSQTKILVPTQDFDLEAYASALATMESNWNYAIINSIGAMGKYQFMPETLRYLKTKYSANLPDWVSPEHFTKSQEAPQLQETYFYYFVNDNLKIAKRRNLKRFYGQRTQGRLRFASLSSKVNIYGIMAGGHLGGMGGVEKYLKGIKDADDGFTSISDYVTVFSDKFA